MYAIGTPGQRPRLIVPLNAPELLTPYMLAGEVVVPVAAIGEYVISAGGEYATAREKTLDELRIDKWLEVKAIRDERILAGAPIAGIGTFDMDADSRVNLLGASVMAQQAIAVGQPLEIGWKMHDNAIVQLDEGQLVYSANAVATFYSAIHARSQQLYLEILAATDAAGLDAIDINTGWPS